MANTLDKYNMKCTFNLSSAITHNASPEKISIEQIKSEVLDKGHEVALHGKTHAALGLTPTVNGVRDVLECRLEFEKDFDRIIRGFAYPDTMRCIGGEKYDRIKCYLKELGVVYARTCFFDFHDVQKDADAFGLPEDFYFWIPTAHHDNKNIFEYIDKFLALDETKIYRASRYPRLFYIWGHSSEFESKGHWGHLEQLCEKISNKEDRFARFPGGKFKAVTFSYDDGVNQDLRFAEILTNHGMKGTFNLNSSMFGNKAKFGYRLTADEIKDNIIAKGHEIAVHGKAHIASACASPIDCIRDTLACREELEETFDMIVRGMAYPDSGIRNAANGNDYATVKQILTNLGVVYSRTLGGDNKDFKLPADWHAWMPTAHHSNPQIFDWIDAFNAIDETVLYSSSNFPRLFYLLGHSYEFDRDDNWEHIEKICEALADKDDVWYATNIEIYDYMKAYDSLIFNVNSTKVYNPTLVDVWFNADCKNYCVKSGETLILK